MIALGIPASASPRPAAANRDADMGAERLLKSGLSDAKVALSGIAAVHSRAPSRAAPATAKEFGASGCAHAGSVLEGVEEDWHEAVVTGEPDAATAHKNTTAIVPKMRLKDNSPLPKWHCGSPLTTVSARCQHCTKHSYKQSTCQWVRVIQNLTSVLCYVPSKTSGGRSAPVTRVGPLAGGRFFQIENKHFTMKHLLPGCKAAYPNAP